MKERVISQSSRLQRNRPSNCDWCNGADRQRTLFAFRCTYTCHTRISIESIAYLLIRARARNIECSFFRFFFTDFQTIKFDEKFYLSRIFAKKHDLDRAAFYFHRRTNYFDRITFPFRGTKIIIIIYQYVFETSFSVYFKLIL